jgi:hypothetical protein
VSCASTAMAEGWHRPVIDEIRAVVAARTALYVT